MRLVRQVEIRYPVGTSLERREDARVAVKVAFSRLLTAVLFAPFVLVVLAFGPRSCERVSRVDATGSLVRTYAFEAFPRWAQANHNEACPQTIHELAQLVADDPLDPWGTELELRCGAGIRGAYVRSAGPDRMFETTDDITSND